MVDALGVLEAPRGDAPFGELFSDIDDRLEWVGVPGFLGVEDIMQQTVYGQSLPRWICEASQGGRIR